jgi:hypothetical protein
VDLMYLAYCEHAGLTAPAMKPKPSNAKWIAEDTFAMATLYQLRRGSGGLRTLFLGAKGRRIYAIWSAVDPLPFLAYAILRFLPQLGAMGLRVLWSALVKRLGFGKRQNAVTLVVSRKGETRG